jgi:hypothetical protein
MTGPSSTSVAMVVSPSRAEIGRHRADESSLTRSARSLADAARAFRETSDAEHAADDLSRAFAFVDAALDDLADGAELVALYHHGKLEATSRRRGRRAAARDGTRSVLASARPAQWARRRATDLLRADPRARWRRASLTTR